MPQRPVSVILIFALAVLCGLRLDFKIPVAFRFRVGGTSAHVGGTGVRVAAFEPLHHSAENVLGPFGDVFPVA